MNGVKIRSAVSEILFIEWDPIGVNYTEACRDEYDGYVAGLARLLLDGADEVKVAGRLGEIARVSMGLTGTDEELHRRTARRLVGLVAGDGGE